MSGKIDIHEKSINLARRWSVQNENDLMQVNFYEEEEDLSESSTPEYDHAKCQELASHLGHLKSLPSPCLKFKDVTADLKRRDTDTTHPTQFLG